MKIQNVNVAIQFSSHYRNRAFIVSFGLEKSCLQSVFFCVPWKIYHLFCLILYTGGAGEGGGLLKVCHRQCRQKKNHIYSHNPVCRGVNQPEPSRVLSQNIVYFVIMQKAYFQRF